MFPGIDLDALRRLDRGTRWRLDASIEVRAGVGHPQGLLPTRYGSMTTSAP